MLGNDPTPINLLNWSIQPNCMLVACTYERATQGDRLPNIVHVKLIHKRQFKRPATVYRSDQLTHPIRKSKISSNAINPGTKLTMPYAFFLDSNNAIPPTHTSHDDSYPVHKQKETLGREKCGEKRKRSQRTCTFAQRRIHRQCVQVRGHVIIYVQCRPLDTCFCFFHREQ